MSSINLDGCQICRLVDFLSKNKNTNITIAGDQTDLSKELCNLYEEKHNVKINYEVKPTIILEKETIIADKIVEEKIEVKKEEKPINQLIKEDHKYKTAVVCVYKSGNNDYDKKWVEYVTKLQKSVHDNVRQAPYDFFVMSDITHVKLNGVDTIPLESDLPGWHAKFEVYREELWKDYRRVLYIDLDTVITGWLDPLLTNENDFMLLRDFNSPTKMATGIVFFNPVGKRWIYECMTTKKPSRDQWDQHLLEALIKDKIQVEYINDLFPIASYKGDIAKGKEPKNYMIVCFHGKPRPHEINWDLGWKNTGKKDVHVVQMRYCPVPQWCKDERVYVIGGGPSLTGIDLDSYLMGKTVLGINDGYIFKCVDTVFFGDECWYNHHTKHISDGNYYDRQKWFSTSNVNNKNITRIKYTANGFSKDVSMVAWNGNSGMCGMNLAALGGANEIILLGFDMKKDKAGEPNWHQNIRKVLPNTYTAFLNREKRMADELWKHFPNIKVINANLDSGLTRFEKRDLIEVLNDAKGK